MLKSEHNNTNFENGIIVAIQVEGKPSNVLKEEIEELILLADTAGAKILDTIIEKYSKNICMHIAASKPEAIDIKDLDPTLIEREKMCKENQF